MKSTSRTLIAAFSVTACLFGTTAAQASSDKLGEFLTYPSLQTEASPLTRAQVVQELQQSVQAADARGEYLSYPSAGTQASALSHAQVRLAQQQWAQQNSTFVAF